MPLIRYCCPYVVQNPENCVGKIHAIRRLMNTLTTYLREQHPKLYRRDIIDVIFEHPYCRIGNLVDRELGTRQAASRYLHRLVGAGVLQELHKGREKLFAHSHLLTLLTRDSNDLRPYHTPRALAP